VRIAEPRRALVIGAGPAGLEYARVAGARGHRVLVCEREPEVGGHVRVHSMLPTRQEYGRIATWLAAQARGNGAEIRTSTVVAPEGLDALLAAEQPDHVVVATGARYRRDGFQGQTAAPLPGSETGNCASWDEVVTGAVKPVGEVLVIDDLQDASAPLAAAKIAREGADSVRLLTRWPMVGMETIGDVYLLWVMRELYAAGVSVMTDHFVSEIDGGRVSVFNVYDPDRKAQIRADLIVMATARESENGLYHVLRERGVSVEMIGDAIAPRGTYEAVYEGHRQARKL
jgi:thioredoxin reductase